VGVPVGGLKEVHAGCAGVGECAAGSGGALCCSGEATPDKDAAAGVGSREVLALGVERSTLQNDSV
jgi:hypothetical protein